MSVNRTIVPYMATIICVATHKGGSGKSSTAINLACALERSKYRVAVIDADPQATFLKWHRKRLQAGRNGFTVESVPKGILEDAIEEKRADPAIDVVIVDCPGNTEDITTIAVRLADAVLSPIRPSSLDLSHSVDTARFIRDMRKAYPKLIFLMFINAAMAQWRLTRETKAAAEDVFSSFPRTYVLDTLIPHSTKIAEFYGSGLSVEEYAPRHAAGTQYRKLTKEVIECLQKAG
jgi:chromosome partitioning protein